jgi:hypothetical protein
VNGQPSAIDHSTISKAMPARCRRYVGHPTTEFFFKLFRLESVGSGNKFSINAAVRRRDYLLPLDFERRYPGAEK